MSISFMCAKDQRIQVNWNSNISKSSIGGGLRLDKINNRMVHFNLNFAKTTKVINYPKVTQEQN